MMRLVRSTPRAVLAAAVVTLAACADGPTAPGTGDFARGAPQYSVTQIGGATFVTVPGGIPTSCAEIKAALPSATDGDYVVGPTTGPAAGQLFAVYCADMGGTPSEYVSLASTGGGKNYSSTNSHTPLRETSFSKIRLDPATLTVDIGDVSFSTTTSPDAFWATRPVAYATASTCPGGNTIRRTANIDLTGTSFSVNDGFLIGGWYSHGTVNEFTFVGVQGQNAFFSVQAKEVNLAGGGFCGGVSTVDFHPGIFLYDPNIWKPGFSLQLAFDGPSLALDFASLCALTEQFVTKAGVANAMCAKLQAAEAAAARGNDNAKAGALNAYKNQIEAQRGKALSDSHANLLINWASQL